MAERIVLCPNPSRDFGLKQAIHSGDMLRENGFEVAMCPLPSRRPCERIPESVQTIPMPQALAKAALVVSMGGDGTMLRVARRMQGWSVPILGVNLGNKGFLASLNAGDDAGLLDAARGKIHVNARMMLSVELIREGQICLTEAALNDVVITGITHTIQLTVSGDGQPISTFSGDGVILATPTGSTAYSMSAGGPIVEPTAEAILMTPVCPHDLAARCFVLAHDRVVTVQLNIRGARRAVMAVDGCEPVDLAGGDIIRVRKSAWKTYIANVGDESFYDRAFNKLIKGK